jgi:hypothetical protein
VDRVQRTLIKWVIGASVTVLPVQAVRADAFTVTFRSGKTEPALDGASGEANLAAMNRIAAALELKLQGAAFEFLLVGPKPKDCKSEQACSELLFRRLRHVRETLEKRQVSAARSLNDNAARYSNELELPLALPTATLGTDFLTLRGRPLRPLQARAECPWSVRMTDPVLPPQLGTADTSSTVQFVSPQHLTVTAQSVLRIAPTSTRGRTPVLIWETADGNFARGSVGVEQALTALGSVGPIRLHLVLAQKAEHPLVLAANALQGNATPAPDMARALGIGKSAAKAFGDDAARARAVDFAAPQAVQEVATCTISFGTASTVR